MDVNDYWNIFLQTGSPEMYLMYREAIKLEGSDVSDTSGAGVTGNRIQ